MIACSWPIVAGCSAFFVASIPDWTWQIAVQPVAMLLLAGEQIGELGDAAAAARAATEREATNWRTWLVLSRIEAERGRAAAAVRAFRRARSLNPHFSLFDR